VQQGGAAGHAVLLVATQQCLKAGHHLCPHPATSSNTRHLCGL
jgi:hypothetical protein